MSKYTVIKTTITNPNTEILKDVIRNIAKKHNLKTTEVVRDYYGGNKTNVVLGVKNDKNGLGVVVRNNTLEVVGDDYNIPFTINEFNSMVVKGYVEESLKQVLKEEGFCVERQESGKDVVLNAYRW